MDNTCAIEYTLNVIKSKWTFLILRDLINGKKRFSELKKSINDISQKVLTSNLRFLEEKGIITRTVYPVVPPMVEYELTALGMALKPLLIEMQIFGELSRKTTIVK
ncbi:helix-turn-helix transcriptional regulator [Spiroplasma sp. TIUS-1]|uniref:winged helix-turn-helix transcriptional regulator n=1 Tax=Spiroplasma sp. TIUS-1 TaxID=216963 RepID=UPI001398D927|nr:helix-turn-helix domain-containing protein [Spiroplasma sp. TIUS-1]QHX36230.1 helix-turn-helix transcriptional regulator [Spiroplasma sp. TIUS-1]